MERYVRRSGTEAAANPSGFETGDRPYLMLDLIFRDGNRLGVAYCYLISVKLDDGVRITLGFTDSTITIEGRNLAPLYNYLLLHQTWRINVATSPFSYAGEVWIKSITVSKPDAGGDAA
jgi:hypothetical protein